MKSNIKKYHTSGSVCTASERVCPIEPDADHIEASSYVEYEQKLNERFATKPLSKLQYLEEDDNSASEEERVELLGHEIGTPLSNVDGNVVVVCVESGTIVSPHSLSLAPYPDAEDWERYSEEAYADELYESYDAAYDYFSEEGYTPSVSGKDSNGYVDFAFDTDSGTLFSSDSLRVVRIPEGESFEEFEARAHIYALDNGLRIE